jgi:parallel beta-helix repeat protein
MGGRRSAVTRVALVGAVLAVGVGIRIQAAHAFTVFKVTNTNNSGDGSLRRAINDANANPGRDAIFFKIPGPGVHTISPLTNLPEVTEDVGIAGDSQTGYSGTPLIQLDGTQDTSPFSFALRMNVGTVFGIDVVNFRDGIWVDGPVSVLASVFGADPGGTVAMPNQRSGVRVFSGSPSIGDGDGHGNLISGNDGNGILVQGGHDVSIQGNLIGTTASGAQALGNVGTGILFNCGPRDTVVGGPGAARNVVSGNGDDGIALQKSDCGTPDGTVIKNNLIGTDSGGTFAVPNAGAGVFDNLATSTRIGVWPHGGNVIAGNQGPGVEVAAHSSSPNTTIDSNLIGVNESGGESVPNTGPGVRIFHSESVRLGQRVAPDHEGDPNVISGNQGGGVVVENSATTYVLGNLIGTGSDGQAPVGNLGAGVTVLGGHDTFIGGGIAGQGNVVSTNTGDGIQVRGDDATGTPASGVAIQGNLVGIDRTGFVALANGGNGISILPQAGGTRIGNVVGLEGPNSIEHNSLDGIRVTGSKGVRIRGNEISANAQLGIRLNANGNDLQDAPVITTVKLANGQLTMKGTLTSTPVRNFAVELFANPSCDPSGFGEGKRLLTQVKVTTDSTGKGSFNVTIPFKGAAKPVVTSTATNTASGNTSEFSQCT